MTQAKNLMPPPFDNEQYMAIQFEYTKVLKNIEALMQVMDAERARCKGCSATLYFIRHANGRLTPYDADGTNHLTTCSNSRHARKEIRKSHE
jgi:hypothetical protein